MADAIWMTQAKEQVEARHNTPESFTLGLHSLCPPPIEYVDEAERRRLADFLRLVNEFERETSTPGMYTKTED